MIIFITGTSKGIGRYLAEYYLKAKHKVIGCSRSDSDLADENYEHYCLDITDEKAVKEVIAKVRKKYTYIDVLINNAGRASMNHFLLTPTEVAKKIMDINYFGTLIMCRELSRIMRKSKNPRIINFTTVARPLNLEGEAVYAASKGAVETLTKVISKELSNYNITVNAIGPTPVRTDLIKNVPDEKLQKLISFQSIKRFGEFDDIVNVIDFFMSERSSFITGQVIYLGGI